MIWVGICIGASLMLGLASVIDGRLRDALVTWRAVKELDREIAADLLALAREKHYAAVLYHVERARQSS